MSDVGANIQMLSGEPDAQEFRPKNTKTLIVGGVAIAVIVIAAIVLPLMGIKSKQKEFETELSQRLSTFAVGRAEVVSSWIKGVLELSGRVAENDFYRIFAAEMDISKGDLGKLITPNTDLKKDGAKKDDDDDEFNEGGKAQIPMMAEILSEYIQTTGFLAAHMVNRNGIIYVTTASTFQLNKAQNTDIKITYLAKKPRFSTVRTAAQGFVVDLYMPIFPPQGSEAAKKVAGVLMLTLPVTEKISEFIIKSPLARAGEVTRLVQKTKDGYRELLPGSVPPIRPVEFAGALSKKRRLPFARRLSIAGDREVFSTAYGVPQTSWLVVQEAEVEVALAGMKQFVRATIIIAVLVVAAVVIAFGAFWWRLVGDHNKNLATQFRGLAAQINAQKQFLDTINNSISDHIGMKDVNGYYVYANPAFAAAVGRPLDKMAGLDDDAIYGHGTAERLKVSDAQVLQSGSSVTVDEEIYLASRKHYFQISKVAIRDDDDKISGLVSVSRDITDTVEQRLRRENAVRQTVVALVRAIELRDPYLGGHSRRVSGFGAAIARQMGLDQETVATVEIAASLSQIGKLSISRAILNKPERLTDEEMAIVQSHVEHAATVLRDLDFGLPVFDAIYQMNERANGSGYPQGLSQEEIRLEARILAVCDVFCARIEPRSYRPAIEAGEAVDILKQYPDGYDLPVIEALDAVVHSPAGDKLMESYE
jgi:PAS domain S-box-containing protein